MRPLLTTACSAVANLPTEQRTTHEKQLNEVRDKLEQKIMLLKKQHEEELREFDQLLNDELNRVHKKYQTELRRLRERGKFPLQMGRSGVARLKLNRYGDSPMEDSVNGSRSMNAAGSCTDNWWPAPK